MRHAGTTLRRTSTTFSSNNFHLNLSSFSFRAHQISPLRTCLLRASLRFNFQQVPQQQQPQLQYQPVRPALPSTSASSVTRVSTPGPHIYDISSINNMYSCGGVRPLGIGGPCHYFNINQLNREHLRIYLEGHFVAGQSSVTPVLLRRLHLETSQNTYLFNHTTLSFLFLQLPTNLFTSTPILRVQRHLAHLQQHQLPSSVLHM